MWKVFLRNENGEWKETPAVEIETNQGPFRSSQALAAAQQVPSDLRQLIKYLEAEAERPELSRDAIELWAQDAQKESDTFDWAGSPKLRAIEEGLALFPKPQVTSAQDDRLITIAWHDHAAVLIPIPMRGHQIILRLEYIAEPEDEYRVERLRFRHAPDEDYSLETFVDWRGYFGMNSAVIDGWTMMRAGSRGYVASFVGTTGFVVGTVLRRLTRPQPTPEEDPTARPRQIGMERKYSAIARSCPDLSTIKEVATHERAMVFVHGTVSCGIQGLKDLFPQMTEELIPEPVYRFEHDTFLKLDANAKELVALIKEHIDTKQLLLAAHSRGGLVAKLAAYQLRRDNYPGKVTVYTFGTPNLGTPLVAIGKRMLNLLYKMGEDFAEVIPLPLMTSLVKGFSYAVNVPTLPPGISAMQEDSPEVSMLQMFVDPVNTRTWGSDFNVGSGTSGFGAAVEGALLGALSDRRHDLVVPTASALAFGSAEPVLACSHTRYFLESAVRDEIKAFLAPNVGATVAPEPRTGSSQTDGCPGDKKVVKPPLRMKSDKKYQL
ncbi:Lipase (class 3) [Nitrosospira briensis]|uniref:Lipase (Class 3) n=1 Tax=Nitrosospira briensis TaxID=35799 RepID=A0A1I5DY10_9PROT|nr:hypothetical protein [Nitrosospira briensis]SFO04079.1 Lipase (class 3) [Nitrosospira briensis]